MSERLDRLVSTILTSAVVVLCGILIHREFFVEVPPIAAKAPVGYLAQWRALRTSGLTFGATNPKISIVEFSEMQCPFCKRFHLELDTLQSIYPDAIQHTFIHFPLPIHAQALPAARAAECAHQQGRFPEMIDVEFNHQSELGAEPWSWFAAQSRVPDSVMFAKCMDSGVVPPRIAAGIELGKRLQLQGTPTFFINGWRINGLLPDSQMRRVVDDLMAGRKPFKGFPDEGMVAAVR